MNQVTNHFLKVFQHFPAKQKPMISEQRKVQAMTKSSNMNDIVWIDSDGSSDGELNLIVDSI